MRSEQHANLKKYQHQRLVFCSLFKAFFKHLRTRQYIFIWNRTFYLFPGLCGLSLKPPWRRFKKQAVSVSEHDWMVACGRRKVDACKTKYANSFRWHSKATSTLWENKFLEPKMKTFKFFKKQIQMQRKYSRLGR